MTSETATDWHDRLGALLPTRHGSFLRAFVRESVDSTQDEARRRGAVPGDIVTALRQHSGRGRSGKSWLDTQGDGLAVTFVLPPIERESHWRVALASAIAAARAIESFHIDRAGIKWPNDIIVNRRKIGGVLVEQGSESALVGIGLNVGQRSWPDELAERAISLQQMRASASRFDVLAALLREFDLTLAMRQGELRREYVARDVLIGSHATFLHDRREVSGVVRAIEPGASITLKDSSGIVELPALTTMCVRAEGERISL